MSDKTTAEVADKVVDGIAAAAKALEGVAPKAWQVMVDGQRADGIADVVVWAALCVAGFTVYRLAKTVYDRNKSVDDSVPLFFVAGGIAIACFLSLLMCGGDTITQIISPEYAAAQQLLESVKE